MSDSLPLAEQISEVKRELSMRAFVYPQFIANRKITQQEADKRVRRLEAVLHTLIELSAKSRLL